MVFLVYCNLDLTLHFIRGGENRDRLVRTQSANTFRVEAGVDCINQSQIGKVIHIDPVFEDYHHSKFK